MTRHALPPALVEAASAPYRAVGQTAYRFARGKLRGDPAFAAILAHGLLSGRRRILDLGCGRGLLAASLLGSVACMDRGDWPPAWPPAPRPEAVRGIDNMSRDLDCARRALGPRAVFAVGDIREVGFDPADSVVLLDVLQYMDYRAQEQVLARVRAALEPGGVLLVRIGDAGGGLRFRLGHCVDYALALLRGGGPRRLYCRSRDEWLAILMRMDFRCTVMPMSAGTWFANVLLVGRLP